MAAQQHAWEMTHHNYDAATVFSHQPLNPTPPVGAAEHKDLYWISGVLPKVMQFGATVIAMHNPEDLVAHVFQDMNMTHAHFNWDIMDEIDANDISSSHWVFGRYEDTYSKIFVF